MCHILKLRYNVIVDRIYKALSDKGRRDILESLMGQKKTVSQLAAELKMGQSTLSGHLAILRKSGLVKVEVKNKWRMYFMNTEVAERYVTEINRLFGIEGLKSDTEIILRKKLY